MTKKLISFSVLMAALLSASAQKDTAAHAPAAPPPIAITGSVDGYYRYNLDGATNNITSFTNSINSFELGMASIRGDHSFGKGGVTVDLGFGRRAADYSYNDTTNKNNLFALKQIFATYQASSKVKLTFGKWGTHVGYEVLDAYSNRNYSMDYMFSYGPFFHTGIKADVTIDSNWAYMLGVANPTDFSTTTSSTKVLLGQLSHTNKAATWKEFLNYQGYWGVGAPTVLNPGTAYVLFKSLHQADLVINGTLNKKWGIGFNGTYQSVEADKTYSWYGAAVYLNYDPTAKFGYTLRAEYIDDKDGIKLAQKGNITDLTLSGIWKIDNCLTIMPEIRLDAASADGVFLKSDGTSTKSTVSALVAAVYKF